MPVSDIVRYPATVQSLKGVVSALAGLMKSARYTTAKVRKYWKGFKGSTTNTSGESL